MWNSDLFVKDWKTAVLLSKGKEGNKVVCVNCRVVNLIDTAARLFRHICGTAFRCSVRTSTLFIQCGFHWGNDFVVQFLFTSSNSGTSVWTPTTYHSAFSRISYNIGGVHSQFSMANPFKWEPTQTDLKALSVCHFWTEFRKHLQG